MSVLKQEYKVISIENNKVGGLSVVNLLTEKTTLEAGPRNKPATSYF